MFWIKEITFYSIKRIIATEPKSIIDPRQKDKKQRAFDIVIVYRVAQDITFLAQLVG